MQTPNHMPKVIFVGGTRAVGKSTILTRIAKRLNKHKKGQVTLIDSGDVLRKYGQEMFNKSINQLTPDEVEEIRARLYRNVQRRKAKLVLMSDHYTYAPRDSSEQVDLIKARGKKTSKLTARTVHYVLVEAPLAHVEERIAAQGKERPSDRDSIRRNMVASRFIAKATAKEHGIPLSIISNPNEKLHAPLTAEKKLEEIIRRHL